MWVCGDIVEPLWFLVFLPCDDDRHRHRVILKGAAKKDPKVHSRPFRLEGRKIQTGAPSSVGRGPLVAGPGLAGCDSSAHDVPALGSGCPTAGPDCGPSTRYDAGQSFVG